MRERLLAIAAKAIESLDPQRLVAGALVVDSRPTTVLALGKAAGGMLAGAREALGTSIVRSVCAGPDRGGHPIPSEGSIEAGLELLAAAAAAGPGTRVVALVSGGGSSLAAVPADGLTLADKQEATARLLASGASIDEINAVRVHLSAIKGGRLAAAAGSAAITTLILSDVVSGDATSVASGPTLAASSAVAEALALARQYRLSKRAVSFLKAARPPPVIKMGTHQVLADNRALVIQAARIAAPLRVSIAAQPIIGSPAQASIELALRLTREPANCLLVGGGEVTPTLPPLPGAGGRAQHLALHLAEVIADRKGAYALVIGSDGADGDGDGAGAIVDHRSKSQLEARGFDLGETLKQADSGRALAAIGAQLPAKATGNNLADLVLVWTGEGFSG